MTVKAELRTALLAARSAVSTETRAQWDAAISEEIKAYLARHPVTRLGVYWPINAEPDLRPLYSELSSSGVSLALPLVIDRKAALQFAAWTPGDAMKKDVCGVPIPAMTEPRVQPDAVLVPCVGFTLQRIRLGYGGGFYDRTLATQKRPVTIGVAYSLAECVFDADMHDVALDCMVTEARVVGAMDKRYHY